MSDAFRGWSGAESSRTGLRRAALAAAFALLPAPAAQAATTTAPLTVRATVDAQCAIRSGTLDFGTYRSGQSNHLQGEVALQIFNCAAASVTVRLGAGNSGNPSSRYMSSGNNRLNYQLFTDPSRSTPWTGVVRMGYTNLVPGNEYPVQIYGMIYGNQTVPPGVYTDTVDVIVEF